MRNFDELSEKEILALAIGNEEEDGRIYADFAEGLRTDYPATAKVFSEMAAEEGEHRRRLIDLYREKFGEHIPLIRRQDVRGFVQHAPVWQSRTLGIDTVRQQAQVMEAETQRFYHRAAARSTDASIRKLLGDLAEIEAQHEHTADQLVAQNVPENVRHEEAEAQRRLFVLRRRCSPRRSRPGEAGMPSWSAWPPRSAPASRWASRRRCRTTAA
jgi:rubrerythrin